MTETESAEEILKKAKPLEDRILGMVSDLVIWNYKTVRKMFPNEHEKSIYRALKKLENAGRIRFVSYNGRLKQYTCHDVSNLPLLVNSRGEQSSIKEFALFINTFYDERGRWKSLDVLNEFPALLGQIFVIARFEDKELRDNYRELIARLGNMRSAINIMYKWLDALFSHPILNGDPEVFKAIITKEQMTNQELQDFQRWYTQFEKSKEQ